MNQQRVAQKQTTIQTTFPLASGILQRKCACGQLKSGGGECENCHKKKLNKPLQTKLQIGETNDSYEQEADHVAEQVMRMPKPKNGEANEYLQVKPLVQRRVCNTQSGATEVPTAVHDVLRSPGQSLDQTTREFMESRFDHDFSHVRIHTNTKAAESAKTVNAAAYTVGQYVVFGKGHYVPGTHEGKRLIAHELVHTLQQTQSSRQPAVSNSLEVSPADDILEKNTDQTTDKVTSSWSLGNNQHGATHTNNHNTPTLVPNKTHKTHLSLQRQEEQPREPWIPIPVFDEFDPMIIVPDIPGVPNFLRGQEVKLSTIRSALETIQGGPPSFGSEGDICNTLMPGHEMVQSGELQGFCCPGFSRDRDRCCRWQEIGPMSFRCCDSDEVVINGRCVRPTVVPTPPISPPTSTPRSALPTVPRLRLQFPNTPFGSIQSDTIDHFVINSTAVPNTGSAILDRTSSQLQLYPRMEVHVEGHTDSSHTQEYNRRLSVQRAQAVRTALINRGVDANRIVIEGFGETQPLFPQELTGEEKARNRRVDVWFVVPPTRGLGQGLRLNFP